MNTLLSAIFKFCTTNQLFKYFDSLRARCVSEPISRILTQVGIGVALKPHHTLSSLFRKPKDAINFEQKRGLVCQISCLFSTYQVLMHCCDFLILFFVYPTLLLPSQTATLGNCTTFIHCFVIVILKMFVSLISG